MNDLTIKLNNMVWYGIVWYGIEDLKILWHDMVWFGFKLCGLVNFLKHIKIEMTFTLYFPLEQNNPLHINNLEPVINPLMLCAKFGCNS